MLITDILVLSAQSDIEDGSDSNGSCNWTAGTGNEWPELPLSVLISPLHLQFPLHNGKERGTRPTLG